MSKLDRVKEKRKFSFKSLSSQLDNIDFDTILTFGNPKLTPSKLRGDYKLSDNENPALTPSYFTNGIAEWREMNCTSNFATFVNEVYPLIGPLPHILFNHEKIVAILLQSINSEGSGDAARAPYAVLSTLLLRDLGESFKIHFNAILESIISNLLNFKSQRDSTGQVVGEMEMVLGSLFYLIKYSLKLDFIDRRSIVDLLLRVIFSSPRSPIHSSFINTMIGIIAYLILFGEREDIEKDVKIIFKVLSESKTIPLITSWTYFVIIASKKTQGSLLSFLASLTPNELIPHLLESVYPELRKDNNEEMVPKMILENISNNNNNNELVEIYINYIAGHTFYCIDQFFQTSPINSTVIIAILSNIDDGFKIPILNDINIEDYHHHQQQQLHHHLSSSHFLLRILEIDDDHPSLKITKHIFGNYTFSLKNISSYSKKDKLFLIIRFLRLDIPFIIDDEVRSLLKDIDLWDSDLLISSLSIIHLLDEKIFEDHLMEALKTRDNSIPMLKIIEKLNKPFLLVDDYWKYFLKNISANSLQLLSSVCPLIVRPSRVSITEIDVILPFLLYSSSNARLSALRILNHLFSTSTSDDVGQVYVDDWIISSLMEIELIPFKFDSDRQKGILLQILYQKLDLKEGDLRGKIVIYSLLGMLNNAFRPLEEELKGPLFSLLMDGRSNGLYAKSGREALLCLIKGMSTFEAPSHLENDTENVSVKAHFKVLNSSSAATSWKRKSSHERRSTANFERIMSLETARINYEEKEILPSFNNGSIRAFLMFFSEYPSLTDTIHCEFEKIFLFDIFGKEESGSEGKGKGKPRAKAISSIVKDNLSLLIKCLSGLKSSARLEEIKKFLYNYLSFPDPLIQMSSLSTIISLKLIPMRDEAMKYLPLIQSLIPLKDSSNSTAPTSKNVVEDQLALLSSEQENLLNGTTNLWECSLRPLLIPIIYGRMTCKLGSSKNGGMQSRRKRLLNYVSTWDSPSIEAFLFFLSEDRNEKRSIGILNLLEDVIHKMGGKILCFTSSRRKLWSLLMSIREENKDSLNSQIESLVMKRILDIFKCLSSFKEMEEMDPFIVGDLSIILMEKREFLHKEYTHSPSSLLSIIHCWATTPTMKESFFTSNRDIFPSLSLCLQEESCISCVVLNIIDIFSIHKGREEIVASLLEGLSGRIIISLRKESSFKELEKCIELLLEISKKDGGSDGGRYKEPLYAALLDILCLPSPKSKILEGKMKAILLIPFVIGEENISSFFEKIISILDPCNPSFISDEECYSSIVLIVDQLINRFKNHSSLQDSNSNNNLFFSLLSLLNRRSLEEIGSWDLKAQVKAFSIIRNDLIQGEGGGPTDMEWEIILILLHPILLRCNDGNARSQSIQIITTFLSLNPCSPMIDERILRNIQCSLSNKAILKDLQYESVQMDSLRLFSEIIHRCPSFSSLRPLIGRSIMDEDPNNDSNVLLSLLHIQIHRRIRAFNRLSLFIDQSSTNCPTKIITHCFIPLCLNNLTIPNQPSLSLIPAAVSPHLITASIECWSSALTTLPSNQIFSRLNYLISRIQSSTSDNLSTQNKIWLRQISTVSQSKALSASSCSPSKRETFIKKLFTILEDKPKSSNGGKKKSSSSSDLIRGNILVAISFLLQDSDDLGSLKKLYTILVGILSSSNFDRREDGRKWIVQLLKGNTSHFPSLLREMASTLQEKTTSIQPNPANPHIFSYSLWFILNSKIKGLTLNSSIQIILSCIKSSLTGRQLQEREAKEWTGKEVEVAQSKGPEILELILKEIDSPLQNVIIPLIEFLSLSKIGKQFTLQSLTTLTSILSKSIQHGLEGRLDFSSSDVSVNDASTTTDVTLSSENNNLKIDQLRTIIYILLTKKDKCIGILNEDHQIIILSKIREMALKTLCWLIKKNYQIQWESFVAILEAFIMESGGNGSGSGTFSLLEMAIKTMNILLISPSAPLIGQEILLPIRDKVLGMILSGDYSQSSLKLLTTLLQNPSLDSANKEFDDSKLRKLINLVVEGHLGIREGHPLLKAILKSGIIRTEIYSLARHLREVMIESMDPSIRTLSRSLYLLFLKEYPLGKEKWEMEIQFLLGNLSYKTPGGRESIILLLGSLTSMHRKTAIFDDGDSSSSSSSSDIDDDKESWIITLASLRSGEEDEKVIKAIILTLQAIFSSLNGRSLSRFIKNIWLPWLERENLKPIAIGLLSQITKCDKSLHSELWSMIGEKVTEFFFSDQSHMACDGDGDGDGDAYDDNIPSSLTSIIVDLSIKDKEFIKKSFDLLFLERKVNPSKGIFEIEKILNFLVIDSPHLIPKRRDISFETIIESMMINNSANLQGGLDSLIRVIVMLVGFDASKELENDVASEAVDCLTKLIERYDSYCHGIQYKNIELIEESLSKLIASSIVSGGGSHHAKVLLKCLLRQEEERDGRIYGSLLRLNGEVQSLLKEAIGGEEIYQRERENILKGLSEKRREKISLNSKWALTNPEAFAKRKLASLKRRANGDAGGGGADYQHRKGTISKQKRHQ